MESQKHFLRDLFRTTLKGLVAVGLFFVLYLSIEHEALPFGWTFLSCLGLMMFIWGMATIAKEEGGESLFYSFLVSLPLMPLLYYMGFQLMKTLGYKCDPICSIGIGICLFVCILLCLAAIVKTILYLNKRGWSRVVITFLGYTLALAIGYCIFILLE